LGREGLPGFAQPFQGLLFLNVKAGQLLRLSLPGAGLGGEFVPGGEGRVAKRAKDGGASGQKQDGEQGAFHRLPFFPKRVSACWRSHSSAGWINGPATCRLPT
jgi:hypothetical protein